MAESTSRSLLRPRDQARLNRYVGRTHRGLERALIKAERKRQAGTTVRFNTEVDRWVIFSDQHRGTRNGADDFKASERAYNAALAYYLAQGHTLAVLGDAEELWQERPRDVLRAYPRTYQLEREFHRRGRLVRFWGNHDDRWESPAAVKAELQPVHGPPRLEVHESLLVQVIERGEKLGEIFLVHGHQGTFNNDRFGGLARLPVRYLWRPLQRLTGISFNTPAKSLSTRQGHNWALYQWAVSHQRMVVIAGHTHKPVFEPHFQLSQLRQRLAERQAAARAEPKNRTLRREAAELAARVEWIAVQQMERPLDEVAGQEARPCYFNAGCCCFSDGDVTGIELADGEIRLVRWPDRDRLAKPVTLARASMREVFRRLGPQTNPS